MRLIVGTILCALFLWFLFRGTDWSALNSALASIHTGWLLLSLIFMFIFGRNVSISNFIKDSLIKMLISKKELAPIRYVREIGFKTGQINDTLLLDKESKVENMHFDDCLKDIFVAYSKYFDLSELDTEGLEIGKEKISELNSKREVTITRSYI